MHDDTESKEPMTKQMYLECEFHRVVLERNNYRACSWLWFLVALVGWSALIALAFKTGIIGV